MATWYITTATDGVIGLPLIPTEFPEREQVMRGMTREGAAATLRRLRSDHPTVPWIAVAIPERDETA